MKIDVLLSGVIAVAAACVGQAAGGGTAYVQDARMAAQGGIVVQWPKDAGTFLFVDAQGRVAQDALAAVARRLRDEFGVDVRLVQGKMPDVRSAGEEKARLGAKGAIWVVDDPAFPMTLAAEDEGWGMLNVAPLLSGAPSDKVAGLRVLRGLNRLFGLLNGCCSTMMIPQCVMRPVHSVAGLDSLLTSSFSPESYTKISTFMKEAGYLTARRDTYYGACLEGWAPAPTNDVQKAIWERVLAEKERGPTNPITIPPPKK